MAERFLDTANIRLVPILKPPHGTRCPRYWVVGKNVGRGLAIMFIVFVSSVLVCATTAISSTTAFRPHQGKVLNLKTFSQQAGGWKVSWDPYPNAVHYRVTVDGNRLPNQTSTTVNISDNSRTVLTRVGPVVKVRAFVRKSVAGTSSGLVSAGRATTLLACTPYTFVGVRGSGQNSVPDGWGSGLGDRASNVYDSLKRRLQVNNSTISSVGLTYPANRADTLDGILTYRQSSQAGGAALRESLARWVEECPTTKIILFGYSQGADIVATEWVVLPEYVREKIVSGILFGDPRYNPEDSSVQMFDAKTSGPLGARTPINNERIRSWCAITDVVCQATEENILWVRKRVHGDQYNVWQESEAQYLATLIKSELPNGYH